MYVKLRVYLFKSIAYYPHIKRFDQKTNDNVIRYCGDKSVYTKKKNWITI